MREIAAFSVLLTGCRCAPSRNIVGSYFPSWLLCALIGIVAAAAAYRVFVATGIDETLPSKSLVYVSVSLSITFFTWLIWFGN